MKFTKNLQKTIDKLTTVRYNKKVLSLKGAILKGRREVHK